MVALAMNGFISRTVLFSLVFSVASALVPQTLAQDAGGAAVASTETAQRKQSVRDAMQKVQEARTAYTAGRYSEAVEFYQEGLALVSKAPASEKLVKFIKDSLADALVAKAMDYRKVGRTDEAVEFLQEAMQVSPGHKRARHELAITQDPVRTNPALTPQQGVDAGKQLARVKGFGQVIVRTGVQALDPVLQLGARRQHKDRRTAPLGAHLAG